MTTTYAQRTGGYVAYESVESNEICAKPKTYIFSFEQQQHLPRARSVFRPARKVVHKPTPWHARANTKGWHSREGRTFIATPSGPRLERSRPQKS